MQSSNQPGKISLPFANSGAKQPIPVASQVGIEDGRASYTDGFPPITRTPLTAGGKPPFGTDMNGILNAVTAIQQWQSAGGLFTYDSALSTSIGGYPKGALLLKSDGSGCWQSTAENNTTNPDTGGAGWRSFGSGGDFALDTGSANTYVCAFVPAVTARVEGQVLRFKVKTTNTGASTFNDGLGAAPLIGGAHAALQGGELVANGDAWVQWNTSFGGGSYILLLSTGGAEQVATATQTQQAVTLAQLTASGLFKTIASVTGSRSIGVTYTNSGARPIFVNVGLTSTGTNQSCVMNVNGIQLVGSSYPNVGQSMGGSFIVPSGATYQVPTGAYTLAQWTEIS